MLTNGQHLARIHWFSNLSGANKMLPVGQHDVFVVTNKGEHCGLYLHRYANRDSTRRQRL